MEASYRTIFPGVHLIQAGLSDVGCKRERNEDSMGFYADPAGGAFLLVVADGVGGKAAGDLASQLAVQHVADRFAGGLAAGDISGQVRGAVAGANLAILEAAARNPLAAGMATTCTAAAIQGRDLAVAHVGDTRAYWIRDGVMRRLTADHSLEAENPKSGKVRRLVQSGVSPRALTRSLGTSRELLVDVTDGIELRPGDRIVLSSDGLTKMVSDEELRQIAFGNRPEPACRLLVDLARERGGPDNITVQVAALLKDESSN